MIVPDGPPLEVVATAVSSTAVSVSWQQPREDLRNGMIEGYLIQYREKMDSQMRFNTSEITNTMKMVENLKFFTDYCFQVSARTSISGPNGQWGPFSMEICKGTREDSKG